VSVKGCAHDFEVTGIGPLNNHAFFGPQTRDVTELGLIPYILAYNNDDFRDCTLLPLPILRLFRHKSIFVRTDRGIRTPADLRGKRVATVGYSSSGLTHVRGIFASLVRAGIQRNRRIDGENSYLYGLKASAPSFETALRYVYDQGLSKRKVGLEEMLEGSTLSLEETIAP
jgi:hypothetical protein